MDLRKYLYSHCVFPKDVKIWDAYSQSFKVMQVPCGKCLHCRNTHINEWCTRLFAERKYSTYCYYVSLDYSPFTESDPVSMQFACETAACYNNINATRHYGLHPLVLCKNHLQDFFKRLRKNINVKLKYFACGEYGTHANGTGFGRPHFHCIIFSNDPISEDDFNKAWTCKGYKIGRVDYKDLNLLGNDTNEQLKIFKYVCKYLQKADFDFEKLATINFHRAYFKSMQCVMEQTDTLFPILRDASDTTDLKSAWREYIKKYSPFIVCSKRTSIGSAYLAENMARFEKQDFRLFGLPNSCVAFPRYYVRKAKERNYIYSNLGETSQVPSSPSRMGALVQILRLMQDDRNSIDTWLQGARYNWSISRDVQTKKLYVTSSFPVGKIPFEYFHFYDKHNKFLFQFQGTYYKVWSKLKNNTYSYLQDMEICDVLKEIDPYWQKFYNSWLSPLHQKHVLCEHELEQTINALYPVEIGGSSYDKFMHDVYELYQQELNQHYKVKLIMQNSKQTL